MTTGDENSVALDRIETFEMKIFVRHYVKILINGIQPSRYVRIGVESPSPGLRSEIKDGSKSRGKMNATAVRMMFVERKTDVFVHR